MGTLVSSSNLSYLPEQEEKMGSLSVEIHRDKKSCQDWSALHMLVEVSCHVSEEERKGMCVLSLVSQQVCPNIASGSSDQENRRIDDKGLKRKRKPFADCHNDKELDAAAKKKKKKRRYMMRVDMGVYQPPPDLPEKYKQMVNGAKAALVIQKQLFTSDVNPDLNRLTLPPKQILCKELLRPNEIEILKPKDALLKVPFIDPELKEEEISLSLWKLSSSNERSLVLKSKWNHIVKKNDLGEGDLIQIWSFRDGNDQLQLALVVVKRAEKRKNGEEVRSTTRSSSVSNVSEDSASASHSGRKCLKIRFKCNASRSESTSTCELLSQ
ncbi:putative B3 domain-containing protein [Rosa sericea]